MGVDSKRSLYGPRLLAVIFLVAAAPAVAAGSPKKHKTELPNSPTSGSAILWQDPGDIHSESLLSGKGGGRDLATANRFTYVKEDLDGTSAKFDVRDDQGRKWRVKLGEEARPETAASRLLWAIGYYANENYFESAVRVDDLQPVSRKHRKRTIGLIETDGTIHNVELRYYPEGEKKAGRWKWRNNPFRGTREFNGLRVIMAVLNNWDLKDENNSTFSEKADAATEQSSKVIVYAVSDVGASFGTAGRVRSRVRSKGNLASYSHSQFIRKTTVDYVDLESPARESWVLAVNPKEFIERLRMRWIGRHIPRQDAKWAGELLARLSDDQIRDAFRAAGYTAPEVDGFTKAFKDRVAELNAL